MSSRLDAEISGFFQCPELKPYLKAILSIDPGQSVAYHDYVAFNFRDDRIDNIKFYCSFFRKLDKQEREGLLPEHSDYDRWISRWQPTGNRSLRDTGCSFAIKVDRALRPTYQFHFRFPFSGALPSLRDIAVCPADLSGNQGISYEYRGSESYQKRYYYFWESPAVMEILRLFGEPFYPGHMIEYTETDSWTKLIHWLPSVENYRHYFARQQWPRMRDFIGEFEGEFGVQAAYPGLYLNQPIRSVYFMKSMDPGKWQGTSHASYLREFASRFVGR